MNDSKTVVELPRSEVEKWKVMGDERHKIGLFQLPNTLLLETPAVVAAIMARCIITKADFIFHNNMLEYVAFSPDFVWIDHGTMPPIYEWQVTEVRAVEGGPIIKYTVNPILYEGLQNKTT